MPGQRRPDWRQGACSPPLPSLPARPAASSRRPSALRKRAASGNSLHWQPCHSHPTCSCRFVFYQTVDMRALRPLEQTRELHPGAQGLEAWLEAHRSAYDGLFGAA